MKIERLSQLDVGPLKGFSISLNIDNISEIKPHTNKHRNTTDYYQTIYASDDEGATTSISLCNRQEITARAAGKKITLTFPDGQYEAGSLVENDRGSQIKTKSTAVIKIDGVEVPRRGKEQQKPKQQEQRHDRPAEPPRSNQDFGRADFEEHLRAIQDFAIDLKKRAEERLGRAIDGQDIALISANQIVMAARDNGIVFKINPESRNMPTGPDNDGIDDSDIPF